MTPPEQARPRHPDPPAVPAPRGAAEPTRAARTDSGARGGREVRDRPGWLSLLEALDAFAAGLVARFEHELTRCGDPGEAARLRGQVERARHLETVTAAGVEAARRAPVPASVVRCASE